MESSPYRAILGRGCPSFWRHTLPSVAVTSTTWPLCWWFLPRQEPQRWWRSYSSECWGWCEESADGSAQGVVGDGGRLPMTQSRTGSIDADFRVLLQMLAVLYSFVGSAESAVCFGQSVVYFPVDLGIWCDDTSQVRELVNCFQLSSTDSDVGRQYSSRTSVFFKLTSSSKSWVASAKQEVRRYRVLSVRATRAAKTDRVSILKRNGKWLVSRKCSTSKFETFPYYNLVQLLVWWRVDPTWHKTTKKNVAIESQTFNINPFWLSLEYRKYRQFFVSKENTANSFLHFIERQSVWDYMIIFRIL